jgi:hypothetical protein
MCHGFLSDEVASVQPEQAEDEHDDDHEADEIDDAVHGHFPRARTIREWTVRVRTKDAEETSQSRRMFRSTRAFRAHLPDNLPG